MRTVAPAVVALFLVCSCLAANLTITPTTTLSAEIGNNTSAADSFVASTNGNLGAGNISKLPIRSLLYPGATTQIYAHVEPWWGKSSHISIGYSSHDSAQVHRQVEDMISRGINGAAVDWYGTTSYEDWGVELIMREAEAHPGFGLIVEIEQGAILWHSCYTTCDATTTFIQLATYVAQTFFPSPAYVHFNGRPVLMQFGNETFTIDWDKVQAAIPGNPVVIHRNTTGFYRASSGGSFAWLHSKSADTEPPDYDGTSYLQDFYKTAVTRTDQHTFGSLYKGFNDILASWAPPGGRHIEQLCGQTWLRAFGVINQWYSAARPLESLQLVTWNDYEEGTEIESGIDNCFSLSGAMNGSVLGWTISGEESTIDHYTVFISIDGQNLMPLADFPVGTHAMDLSTFSLDPGAYTLYIKAVGKSSLRNQMSGAVSYTVNHAPAAMLSVSATTAYAPAVISASTVASSDPDGSVASSLIDFGDGTVASGPSASHTYTMAGSYTVMATVTDNLGASSSTSQSVTINPAAVVITDPKNATTVNSPVHISAYAVSGRPISSMIVYLDDVNSYKVYASSLDTYLKMAPSAHTILIKSWDNTGAITRTSVNITVANQPPVAALSLSATSGLAPLAITASTAGSSDSDGSIASSSINFGDGTIVTGSAVSHTYSRPGIYTVTATVKDNAGASATATSVVTVAGVDIQLPGNGTSVRSPVHIVASAIGLRPIASMIIYVDNVNRYHIYSNSLDTYLAMSAGSHTILVKSWDNTGTIYRSSVSIKVN